MGDSATTSDCSKQNKQHLGIAKLRLPTLAGSSTLKPHFHDAQPFHFELIRSEARKGRPPLLAALFSNDFFRIPGTAKGSSRPNLVFQNNPAADFIAKNPLVGMLAGLFSEIKQEVDMEARKFWLIQSEYLKECIRRSIKPAAIYRNNNTPPPADNNTQILKLKNDLSFLVTLFFEIMEGWDSEGIKKKAACEMPSLPDIYNNNSSTKQPKATTTSADKSVNADVASFNHISGFNTLFNLASKRKY